MLATTLNVHEKNAHEHDRLWLCAPLDVLQEVLGGLREGF